MNGNSNKHFKLPIFEFHYDTFVGCMPTVHGQWGIDTDMKLSGSGQAHGGAVPDSMYISGPG